MHKQKSIRGFWGLVKTLSITAVTCAAAVCSLSEVARGANLTSWKFDPATNQLEINLNEGRMPKYFLLSQPPRIVIDLPHTDLKNIVERKKDYSGSVRQIRLGMLKADVSRIVLELSPQVVLTPEQVQMLLPQASNGDRWLLRASITGTPAESTTTTPTPFPPALPPLFKGGLGGDLPQRGARGDLPPTPPTNLPPATFTTAQTPIVTVPPPNRDCASTAGNPAAETLPTILKASTSAQILQTPTTLIPRWQTRTTEKGGGHNYNTIIESLFGKPLPQTTKVTGEKGKRGREGDSTNQLPMSN